jgi:hypothetical protein
MHYFIFFQIGLFTAIFSMEGEKPQSTMTVLTCQTSIHNTEELQDRFNKFLNIYNRRVKIKDKDEKYNATFFGTNDNNNTKPFYAYYKSQSQDAYADRKQIQLERKISDIIKSEENFRKIIDNTQIVYPSSNRFDEVKEMYTLKVPIYIGGGVHLPRETKFYRLIWNEEMKNKGYDIYTKPTIPAFPSGLFPWYYYDNEARKLEEKPDNQLLGIIFAHGVNFESEKTPDYKNFLDTKGILKEDKANDLQTYIQEITDTIIYSALILTQKANKKICYLRIPKMGLGQFLKKLPNDKKDTMIELYLSAFKNSLIKYHEKFLGIGIYADFFNYNNDQNYSKIYNSIFDNNFITKNEKIIPRCDPNGDIFKKDLINAELTTMNQNDIQTVILHAGDAHAFLGNGGYYDASLERALLGFHNNDYLSPAHILNIILGDFFRSEEARIKTKEGQAIIEGSEQNRIEKKERTEEVLPPAKKKEEKKIVAPPLGETSEKKSVEKTEEKAEQKAPDRKDSRSFLVIIIIGGLLLGGIIFYTKTYLDQNIFLPIKNYLRLLFNVKKYSNN